jgi:AraC family transcriptional regulator
MTDLHSHLRYRSALVDINDVRCRPSTLHVSGEEQTTAHKVVFPRAGVFIKHIGRRQIVANPNQVLFFNAYEPYRVSHPSAEGDDCTTFTFTSDVLMEVLRSYDTAASNRPDAPFNLTDSLVDARTVFLQQRLRQRLVRSTTSALEADEAAVDVLHRTVHEAWGVHGAQRKPHRPGTLHLWREWVESAKLTLTVRPEAHLSLSDIAPQIYCSPYHLARLFGEQVGLSLHQYQLCLRLALALERLAEEHINLTELAFDLGFSSHSHFTAAFQHAFTLATSTFRRNASRRRLGDMRKILTARCQNLS